MSKPRMLFAMVLCLLMLSPAFAAVELWVGDSGGILGTVDVATGNVNVIGNMGTTMTDIAFSPGGQLFGVSFSTLYRIDKTNANATLVGALGTSVNSLVFDATGTLFAANNALYTIDTTSGVATAVGNGGDAYSSSGDLAFIAGNLYLSSTPGDSLLQLDKATGVGTLIGPIGFGNVFGLATDNNVDLYGTADTQVLSIDVTTGAGVALVDYSGQGLGPAFGSAFIGEAGEVPEPGAIAIWSLLGLVGLGWYRKRKAV